MNDIYRGVDPEELVMQLRLSRPLTATRQETFPTETLAYAKTQSVYPMAPAVPNSGPDKEFIFSREAELAMRDGQIRHAAMVGLERFAERPESSDVRKIKQTRDVWELKLHRHGLRVYFYYAGENRIGVLLVGPKKTQDHDILRLQDIRSRASL